MPKRTTQPKTAAQRAGAKPNKKPPEVLPAEPKSTLLGRILAALILTFLALFLLLSMVGVRAAVLDLLRKCAQGLFGYGFYLLPAAFLLTAWRLVFRNHEPWIVRTLGLAGVVISFSALLHGILCYAWLDSGLGLIVSLWKTGMSGASGGVIPGLLSQGLIFCVSKGGAIPMLLAGLIAMVFVAFHISAPMLIHKRAEKRRKLLEERSPKTEPQPEPIQLTPQMTMEDLKVLGTGFVRPNPDRPRGNLRRRTGVDSPFDEDEDSAPRRRKSRAVQDEDDDFLSLSPKNTDKKPRKLKKSKSSDFNPFESDDSEPEESYTAQVQRLIADPDTGEVQDFWGQEMELGFDDMPVSDGSDPAEPPQTLTDTDLESAAQAAEKSGKVTKSEAAQAAAAVAMEIEARADQEAGEEAAPPYQFPPMTMLTEALGSKEDNTEEMRTNVLRLEETLHSFNVDITIENVVRGPTVTRYEMELRPGVKMNKITNLHEDIALALGVSGVRVAPVPGKSSIIGIEVPNRITTSVPIREVLSSDAFRKNSSALAVAVGKDIGGNCIVGDLSKMPHLLIAGTTGSGKSVCMNSIIVSLLYRSTPEQVRMIMIDPKMVELSIYNGIPHLLIPVVTDSKKAAGALQWAVTEMERRYHLFAENNVRDIKSFNKLAATDPMLEKMPYIAIIIDELADLMMVVGKDVEDSICRIAQKARAAGMHLIVATQRPSVDVITGLIKANIPSRIAFAVSSQVDSRTILDGAGAEKLLGMGDMLFMPVGAPKPIRIQGTFVRDEEISRVLDFIKQSATVQYDEAMIEAMEKHAILDGKKGASSADADEETGSDPMLKQAVEVVIDAGQASTSLLQRRCKLGYARAARIMDEMEQKGIIGPYEGAKPRAVLISRQQWLEMQMNQPDE